MSEEIVIRPAGPDKPGFMRRMRTGLALQQRVMAGDPTALDELLDFVLDNADEVTVPAGVDPRDALLDLSQDEWNTLMGAVAGSKNAVDPPNDG